MSNNYKDVAFNESVNFVLKKLGNYNFKNVLHQIDFKNEVKVIYDMIMETRKEVLGNECDN